MLVSGWKLAYQANAEAIHSHPMGLWSEFYAVLRYRSPITLARAGFLPNLATLGAKVCFFLLSELRYLLTHAPHLIPLATLKNATKWLGYQTGLRERYLPLWSKRMLSSQKAFWKQPTPLNLVKNQSTQAQG